MMLLFDADYPQQLIEALDNVLKLYPKAEVIVRKDELDLPEDLNDRPIVFLTDWNKRGIATAIKRRYESGYRVFAFKYPPDDSFDQFRFATTILALFPKVINIIETTEQPFLYTLWYGKKGIQKIG